MRIHIGALGKKGAPAALRSDVVAPDALLRMHYRGPA
jgi:hypothetical protein